MNEDRQARDPTFELPRAMHLQDESGLEQLSGLIERSSGIARRLDEPFLLYLLGMAAGEVRSITERRNYLSSD